MGLSNHTRTPTGNTPFALAYGMDAIIPTEIGLPTIRTEAGTQDDANEELGRNLDWADEVRETASIRMADYQQRASAHYNRKARPRSFKNDTSVRSCLTSPSEGSSRPPPHAGGSPQIPLGSLPQQALPGEPRCPLEQRINCFGLLQSQAQLLFTVSVLRGEGLHIISGPQQVRKQVMLLGHAAKTAHHVQKNP
ncbi:hypothetical protein CK203_113307 [Vitis vinifera]|uniref:Uncharacterized protein n=1 Tax=Vitis vinifera TaxID=29760 RepID=A0A438FGK9_VITVI|nr:hypothetical protein CK203_113307 [Vitis vinifera]